MSLTETVRHWAAGHQVIAWSVSGGVLLAATVAAVWLARTARRAGRDKVISTMINLAALIATAVQASGMWKFFGNTMNLPVGFRVFMFAFMEIALLATGMRARANVEEGGDAGIDGVLVWVLALASGFMSATDAGSVREGLMRVLVSVVVALLWTRDLMAAKQAARKEEGKPSESVRWRFSVKELAVKLGMASPVDSSLASLDANRRTEKFLRASDRRRALEQARPGTKAYQRSVVREATAQGRLMRHARLHADPTELMARLGHASMGDAMDRLGVAPADASAGPDVRGSAGPWVRGSEPAGVLADASASPQVRESEPTGIRESVDGPASESTSGPESAGQQGPDPAGLPVRGSVSAGADRVQASASGAGSASVATAGSEVAGLIPGMRHTPDIATFAAAQTMNGYGHHAAMNGSAPWLSAGSTTAGLTESEDRGVRESEGPVVTDPQGPWVRESVDGRESASARPSVRESASASESARPSVRESADGRESVDRPGSEEPWSVGMVESDPRWTDETGQLARQIISQHFQLDNGRPTRRAFLEELRERGGTIASAHRTALYKWAMAPNVPTEAELGEDDTADYPQGIPGLTERLERDGLDRTESEG